MNKTALITGAASGIGLEFAKIFAKNNYDLVLIDVNEEMLNNVISELKEQSSITIHPFIKDLSDVASYQEIYNFTSSNNIHIHTLVNNAGFGIFGKFSETDLSKENIMINVHIDTTVNLSKLYLKDMLLNNEGGILNVASLAGFQPGPLMSMYYATKAFVISFTEAIAREHKEANVNFTVLCPGITKTGFQKTVDSENENKITTNMASAYNVALYGFNALQKGKIIAVPGALNKILAFLPRIFSRSMARNIVYKIQAKNRKS